MQATKSSRGVRAMPGPNAPWSAIVRNHLADYLALAALASIAILTEHAKPFIRPIYSGPDGKADEEMWRYSYPLVDRAAQRIPAAWVPLIAFLTPLTLVLTHSAVFGASRLELHASLLSLLSAIFAVGAATNTIKIAVGRPRPNFAARCWPHGGAPVFDAKGIAVCAPDAISPLEGRKSFPSGHTSWTAAGCGWAAWWLAGKLAVWSKEAAGHPWRLCVAACPIAFTVFVGISRSQDNWHHPSDIVAGGALGLSLSYLFYRQTYHCFTSSRAGEAYAGGGGEAGGEGAGAEGAALAGNGGGGELGV